MALYVRIILRFAMLPFSFGIRPVLAVVLSLAFFVNPSLGQHSLSPPNILLILTDDQGYGDFSIHGNPHLKTPNIDQLGREGVRFDRFYVNSFCAPTRAALLTGRWPLRTGCHGVTHHRESMRSDEVTIADALTPAGYRSACIGKWHNGEQYPLTPMGQGFTESFGFNNGHWNQYFNATLLRGHEPEATQGYIADVLTDEAIRFISRTKDKPFFCYLSFNTPHSPYQVPATYFQRFKQQGFDDKVAAFYGMCENIDHNVGRVLKHLEKEKLAENTIVVFLTDNGGTAGVKLYNAGMRGGKTSVHEGGSRVPLFIRWPAAQWPPHVVQPITSHIDLLPTLLDLCQVTLTGSKRLDGVSLKPLLETDSPLDWPERTLFTHNPIDETNKYPGAVRTQKYRLVRTIKGPSGGSSAKANDSTASAWQLYDMEIDPGEKKNIAADLPDVVKRLSQLYDTWYQDISATRLERLPIPIGYPLHRRVELHAPQAYFDSPLQFANGPGFANDWLTQWTDPQAKVWFEIDVAQAGVYEITLAYASPSSDSPVQVRLGTERANVKVELPSAESPEIPLPHLDATSRGRYRNRNWAQYKAGTIKLDKGRTRLTITPINMPGPFVMDLKHVELYLKDDESDAATLQSSLIKNPESRPNILFILADDLGWGDLGCYGNPDIDTPNLDQLAAAGVRLTAHYSPSPLCAPARAGYLTGRYNHRTGAVDVPSNRGLDRISLSEKTFGDFFQHAGYRTGYIGKWHNGIYCRDYLPHRRGFDQFIGFANGGQDYWKWNLLRNDEDFPHDGRYLTDTLNDEAIEWIRQSSNQPFALVLAHHAPHSPLAAPKKLVEKYRYKLGEDASEAVVVTYAMIEAMDRGLGRVFQSLKDLDLWNNTVIVFTSDNGPWHGRDPQLGSQKRYNGPFSGQKQDALEGGIRVPALVCWENTIRGHQVVNAPIHGCDWLPTLYNLTQSTRPTDSLAWDGVDIMPILLGTSAGTTTPRTLHFQRNRYAPTRHANAATRQGDWKLYWPGTADTLKKDSARDNPAYLRGIVHPHWEMPLDRELGPASNAPPSSPKLFNLANDPAEALDVAGQYPEVVQSLSQAHNEWYTQVSDDWNRARQKVLSDDRIYWSQRQVPDPRSLYHDYWLWRFAPEGTNPQTSDPLTIFRGFWNDGENDPN